MPITIIPPVNTITIGAFTVTNADWEANAPGTLSLLANEFGTSVQALGSTSGALILSISGSATLTTNQAANITWLFQGALSADATITFPAGVRSGTVANNTTGGFNIIIGYASGRQLTLPMGSSAAVYGDGVNFSYANGMYRTPSLGAHIVDTLEVDAATTLHAYLIVDEYITVGGDVDITGALNATGDAVVSGTLDVGGDTTIGGALTITGITTVLAATTYVQTINVGDALNVTNDIDCTGDFAANSLTARHTSLNAYVTLNSPLNGLSTVEFQSAGTVNWRLTKNDTSGMQLDWFDSSGVYMATPIRIDQGNGYLRFLNLPLVDPGIIGTIWNNAGVLSVSL